MTPINSIEKRFPWSFFGFLLGSISLGIAIWFFYLSKQEAITDLKFVINDEFQLIELKEKFPDIKIFYNEEDIINSGKVIKIIRIQLENTGKTILQSYYDQKLPFGLEFLDSTILSVAQISTSNGYLDQNLFQNRIGKGVKDGKILFNKPIIEKGSRLFFKVYLLQNKTVVNTVVKSLGKISGMDKIQVVRSKSQQDSGIKIEKTTSEIVAISLASGYFGILLMMLTIAPIALFYEYREKRTREKKGKEFVAENKGLTDEQKGIILSYEKGWQTYYLPTIQTLVNGGAAIDLSELFPSQPKCLRFINSLSVLFRENLLKTLPLRWNLSIFTISEMNISLNNDNKEVLINFLKKCGEIKIKQDV
jgi:hypothetical protein